MAESNFLAVHAPTGLIFKAEIGDGKVVLERDGKTTEVPTSIYSRLYLTVDEWERRRENNRRLQEEKRKKKEVADRKKAEKESKQRDPNRKVHKEIDCSDRVCEYVILGMENAFLRGCFNPAPSKPDRWWWDNKEFDDRR